MSVPLSQHDAMNKPLEAMTNDELKYTLAYCAGQVMRIAVNSTTMDQYENRRLVVEQEINNRRQGR